MSNVPPLAGRNSVAYDADDRCALIGAAALTAASTLRHLRNVFLLLLRCLLLIIFRDVCMRNTIYVNISKNDFTPAEIYIRKIIFGIRTFGVHIHQTAALSTCRLVYLPAMTAPPWCPALQPAPLDLDLRTGMHAPLSALCADDGLGPFWAKLHDLDIRDVEQLRENITGNELREVARGTIRDSTLKMLAKLIEPAGFVWPKAPEAGETKRRRVGGNGNNKPTMSYLEQCGAAGVPPLDPATFRWGPAVFNGIPKKGEAPRLNPFVERLFDNLFDAQLRVPPRAPTPPEGAHSRHSPPPPLLHPPCSSPPRRTGWSAGRIPPAQSHQGANL